MAQIAIHHNPFQLHENVEVFTPRDHHTIRSWLNNQGIAEFTKPTLCLVNGDPVLRKDWPFIHINDDMVVSFVSLPQGGGGGKILRTVLSIAIMVAAPYAGAALAGTLGVTSAIGTSLITAARLIHCKHRAIKHVLVNQFPVCMAVILFIPILGQRHILNLKIMISFCSSFM